MTDQERLARALGYEPTHDGPIGHTFWTNKDARLGFCVECDGFPAIDWSIVPTVLADIEKRGWKWMRFDDGQVGIDGADGRQFSGSRDPFFPTALVQAYVEAVEGQQ